MRKNVWRLFLIILIVIFVETVLFNFRHWESLSFDEHTDFDITIGDGLVWESDDIYKVTDSSKAFIEIENIEYAVKNVYIDIFPKWLPSGKNEVISLWIDVTDEANGEYLRLPKTEVVNGVTASMYKRLYLVGDSSKLKISLADCDGREIRLGELGINKVVPFEFHYISAALLFFVLVFVYGVWCVQNDLKEKIDLTLHRHRALIGIAFCINLLMLGMIFVTFSNKHWQETEWKADLQYNYLAESLAKGHVWLDIEPPSALEKMDNPYDPVLRYRELKGADESCIVDLAYYNGRYYSYFGIVPEILLFLPFYLITGNHLYCGAAILLVGVLFAFAALWFVLSLVKRFYKNLPLGMAILSLSWLISASGIVICLQSESIYTIPIAFAIFFGMLGIDCWMNAVRDDGSIDRRLMVAGAVFMALIIGCRPQMAVIVIAAFPLLGVKNIRKSAMDVVLTMIPFIVVSVIVMYYNYLRFGNPLDFGFGYMLTSQDMSHRGFIFGRYFLGFFEFLFQPFNINAKFPYIFASANVGQIQRDYMGLVVNEGFIAGFFWLNPLALLSLGKGKVGAVMDKRP